MCKDYPENGPEINKKHPTPIQNRISKIISRKSRMEPIEEERKENIKHRKNLVLGVYCKETGTFYEVVVSKRQFQQLRNINRQSKSHAEETCSTKL